MAPLPSELSATATPSPAQAPAILYVRLFRACNAGCFMCDCAHVRLPRDLDHPKLVEMLEGIGTAGVREVRFTGGEPLLYARLEDLVRVVSGQGVRTRVMTHGGVLGDARIAALLDAGLDEIVVSIDGPHAALHDAIRAMPGLFDRAVAGLVAFSAAAGARGRDVRIGITTVVMAENVDVFERFAEFFEMIDAHFWAWNPIKDRESSRLSESQVVAFHRLAPTLAHRVAALGVRLLVPVRADGAYDTDIFGATPEAIAQALAGRYPSNRDCRVLERAGYLDVETEMLHACPVTIHRGGTMGRRAAPRGLEIARVWSSAEFAGAREQFSRVTHEVCTGCEPALRYLHASAAHSTESTTLKRDPTRGEHQ